MCCIEFGICITPFVILLFGDFTVTVFLGLLCPSGKLNSYLTDIEQQAQDLFLRLVKEYADRQGVTEQLKAENQLEWVGKMNNIRSRAVEIIDVELICV
ncbi:MAG TPA: TnpV protein [Oscillospiraceae bacterium]|nr:TnpV protein [Oscillospiraceae bacterium]